MTTLHLISHTHWDREWYLPFQVFRIRLVNLIDSLIDIFDCNNAYAHFMLDGQTIILDDYLAVRPQNEAKLRLLIQDGRISIGPWHILPDEFLVSPEASVRNLLQGSRTSKRFGAAMAVGYIPDPFGHIAQMPQILQGFGIENACFQRGLSDEPCELNWEAPDGSRVLVSYLREGYGNAAYLALQDPDLCLNQIKLLSHALQPYSTSSHLLLMQGTDHTWPEEDTPAAVEELNRRLDGDRIIHTSLPSYFQALRQDIGQGINDLPVIRGHLRDPRRSPLLPGVLSARMWIKQRNHACQVLLEKWAEPFCALAEMHAHRLGLPSPIIHGGTTDIIRTGWRHLMECHPHDSICGCSIDQVHEEMKPRFDQVIQVGEDLTRRALYYLAGQVDTNSGQLPVVVFNPHSFTITGPVRLVASLPDTSTAWSIVAEDGQDGPVRLLYTQPGDVETIRLSQEQWMIAAGRLRNGEFSGQRVTSGRLVADGEDQLLELILANHEPTQEDLDTLLRVRDTLVADPPQGLVVRFIQPPLSEIEFIARDVPGLGWKTYNLVPAETTMLRNRSTMENEYFRVQLSPDQPGCIDVLDKESGVYYPGLHYFTSGGDRGDEYNYCPPERDQVIHSEYISHSVESFPGGCDILIEYVLDAPVGLSQERSARSSEKSTITIQSRISLRDGLPRLDIRTKITNPCCDHRLRVHFCSPFTAKSIWIDGHYEVYEHSLNLPAYDETSVEHPRPESYQRAFTTISDGKFGLTIANRGLPEVEVLNNTSGKGEIALTLLRSVGWLSRPDLSLRRGNAGPALETPAAQMQGSWEFDYSIIPHAGSWQNAFQQAYGFDTPMRAVVDAPHPGILPASGQFIKCEPHDIVITCVKRSEDERGLVIRGVNLSSGPIQAKVNINSCAGPVYKVRLDETIQDLLPLDPDHCVIMAMRNNEIASLLTIY